MNKFLHMKTKARINRGGQSSKQCNLCSKISKINELIVLIYLMNF